MPIPSTTPETFTFSCPYRVSEEALQTRDLFFLLVSIEANNCIRSTSYLFDIAYNAVALAEHFDLPTKIKMLTCLSEEFKAEKVAAIVANRFLALGPGLSSYEPKQYDVFADVCLSPGYSSILERGMQAENMVVNGQSIAYYGENKYTVSEDPNNGFCDVTLKDA